MAYILTVVFELHSGVVRVPTRLERESVPWWASDKTVTAIFSVAAIVITGMLFGNFLEMFFLNV